MTRLFLLSLILLLHNIVGHAQDLKLEIIPLRHRLTDEVLPVLQPLVAPGGTLSSFALFQHTAVHDGSTDFLWRSFSQFRLDKKLAALRQAVPTLKAIHAEFVHFALVRGRVIAG